MSPRPTQSARGTVTLVALCFVAVLGIALASYLAVCTRAMTLSNRSFQAGVAQQLAEFGLEEGLRAFNKGDWSAWAANPTNVTGGTTAWTLDTTNKRASRTLTFGAGKLGQSITATVKIRVDNYDANVVGSPYNSSVAYKINDLVSSSGIWYRCLKDGTGQALTTTGGYPNLSYWAPESVPWKWSANITYARYDAVCYSGTWYYYNNAASSAGSVPGVSSNWTSMPAGPVLGILTNTPYTAGTFGFRINEPTQSKWYVCTTTMPSGMPSWDNTKWSASTNLSWIYNSSNTYKFNDLVFYSPTTGAAGNWYRCTKSSTGPSAFVSADWEITNTGIWAWNSGSLKYAMGDVVYYSTTSQWYRCIQAHTSSSTYLPTNTTYWSPDPSYSPSWDSGRQYSQNDTIYYNGVWYLSLGNSNITNNPATATTWWIGANTTNTSYLWNNSTAYASGAYRCYAGVWYKCTAAHTGQSPNNTSYWTPTWSGALAVTTGAPVLYAEATVSIAGNPPIRTQLRAAINPAPLLPNALGATDTLTLSAGGTIDSFDSTTADYVNPGTYAAVVASTYSGGTAVTNFGATIQGYVSAPSSASSPYAPLASFGSNAVVKGTATTPTPKADLSRVSRSPYVPLFDTVPGGSGGLAATWGSTPKSTALATATTLNIGTPGATTPARYWCSSLTIDGTSIANLNINGPVILYIQGNLVLGGATANTITITSTGSAEIHVGGAMNINQTSGGIVNATKDPKKAVLICDNAGSSTLNYSDGDNDFYGVIYAPYTAASSGFLVDNSNVTILGAVSAKKISYSQDANVHYDTSLRYATIPGVDQPYAVTDWRVLPATEQATMP